MDEYLKRTGFESEDKRLEEQRNFIDHQLKTKILLDEIAEKENIKPEEKDVEAQVAILKQRRPDASIEDITTYVQTMLTNEAILQFLEIGEKPSDS